MNSSPLPSPRLRRRPWLPGAVVLAWGALLASLAWSQTPSASRPAPPGPDPELGKQIYRTGVLPSGRPIRATILGDIAVEGAPFSCASCHRRSGFGSGEGAVLVPPVTGPSLFRATELVRADLFRKLDQEVHPDRTRAKVRAPRVRAAYSEETLATALREGVDPGGRPLDPAMPRYRLDDESLGHLIAYLRTLASAPDPGVEESRIHFATVVAAGAEEDKRRAMLDVMEAYFRRRNTETRGELLRRGHSPWHRDDFYGALRSWTLHVWRLDGPSDSWPRQLESRYRERPVFALLGGIGAGDWRPVHEFCQRFEVPCLFPNTDLPVASPPGAYSLYLSQGLSLEARALARHVHDSGADASRVIQVYRDLPSGLVPARTLRSALLDQGIAGLEDRIVPGPGPPSAAFWESLLQERPSLLVLWLEEADLRGLGSSAEPAPGVQEIYLSHSLLEGIPATLPESLRDRIRLTYPFALPGEEVPRIYRIRAWLRSRRIERRHERLQLNTYFALSVADHSLTHLVERFSRDYFVESVEHETENALNPGVFPRLSLGPGQRFASKGCYIVRLSDGAEGGIEAVSEWIVP